ncbi:conserved exported protein of unknown function [Bartonella clarridgeiae 73]|uniref:Uncharacterized protein n=1 Tax=Bartonella clarridgeiae (strain CCUG 45776 / CIP 104772 / 73) TaxID=696125 RepID=E6YJ01_BARC7|nr:hypothetical protein [Bartonella clarridgeiae]WCR55933.1 MAG: Phage protein [Bartonella clarridgeiae]CBI76839.1 conserved exported protein of unknown function [Bartonella clarridgeiae 73]
MEKRLRARRKSYRKKLYKKMTFVCIVLFCVLTFSFVVERIISHFFFKQEIVQEEPVKLIIPTFDFRVYCKEIAALATPDMVEQVYHRCFNLESEAFFTIRKMWENSSDDVKKKCIKIIRPGDGNYFLLRDCLLSEKEKSEGNSKERHHF